MEMLRAAGAVIFRRKRGRLFYLLVKHLAGHWSFPKGHAEKGESDEQTALREIYEETGLQVALLPEWSKTVIYSPRLFVRKKVTFFAAQAYKKKVALQEAELSHHVWLEYEDALRLITHHSLATVLRAAHRKISPLPDFLIEASTPAAQTAQNMNV